MSPEAIGQLTNWGLDEGDAARAGLFETPNAKRLYSEMAPAPALVIPYFDPATGLLRTYGPEGRPFARVRWLAPVETGGGFRKPKIQRYAQPLKSGVAVYFPPLLPWAEILADASQPLVITEGEAKALAAVKAGFACLAFGGVYSFTDRNGELLPELAAIEWRGRDVFLAYDSDAVGNPSILAAEARLVHALQREKGACVRVARLPAAKDGSKVGLDDFLKEHGASAFAKLLDATPRLSALDARIIELNKECAWIERESMIWDLDHRMLLRKDSFVAGSRHSVHVHYVPGPRGLKEISVAQSWLRHPYAQRFGEVLFRPGEDQTVIGDNGQPALNMWRGWDAERGDVTPFVDLSEHILQRMRETDRQLPIKLLAYKAQNPELKIPLALVMVGPQGGGKSLWGECVRQAFGEYGIAISAEQMVAQFNAWLEKSLVAVVNEVSAETFRANAEKIRSLISELRTPMEEKFRPTREVNSYTFYIINSNKRAVSSYDVDDRRMIVIDTPPPKQRNGAIDKEFYARVGAWLKAGGGRHLLHWLLHYPLEGWQPPNAAPESAEKTMAYHEGLTPIQELAHAMRTSRVPMVETWLDSAAEWARRAELAAHPSIQALGQAVLASLSTIRIQPWYTPQELAMLFPSILEQTQGSRMNRATGAGQISRELREAGIPYLRSADAAGGFWHKGQLKQYLIVSDFAEWAEPIRQEDFDRLIGTFPTYADVKAARRARQ